MKPFCALLTATIVVLGATAYARAQDEAMVEEVAVASTPEPAADGEVQTLGEGDQRIHLVRHGNLWSMHFENLVPEKIFELWQQAGGPAMTTKGLLDYPYTLSVHRVRPERIVERVLEDYSFTLHYDGAGRLAQVRVYSPSPSRMFKTPRLVESLGSWIKLETPEAESAPGDQGAAPAETDAEPAPAGEAP